MSRGGRSKFAGFRNQPAAEKEDGVHPRLLKQGRQSGQLNLSNRELITVPDSVWKINEDIPEEARNVSLDNTEDRWWEQVDLAKLILASNKLTEIGDGIQQLPALTVLDVHDNQICSLPDVITTLVNLQRLNASHNNLRSLPIDIDKLLNLSSLHVEHNQLTELPKHIGRLYNLEDLDVSNNQLTAIPSSIGYLTKVTKFNIANNKISILPPEIGAMVSLKQFEATHNLLNRLPDEMGILRNLEQVFVRHNRITHLPVLEGCKQIKELHLGNNAIKGLTVEHLKTMPHLSVLDLRDNQIALLPEEITLLEDLERLDLTNNDLSRLPFVLGTLPKLKSIVLDGNPMKGIRRDIIIRGTVELKKYLVSRLEEPVQNAEKVKGVRHVSGQSGVIGGGDVGVDAHTVGLTKVLDYSGKKSSEIPSDIWELASTKQIVKVDFSKNALQDWPSNLVLMSSSAKDINFGFNKLSTVSPDIGKFTQLTCLDLRNNLLNDLPDSMRLLTHLRDITLSFNRFKHLPQVLYVLKSIENVLASDNQIDSIDAEKMHGLPVLASLDLRNNNITQVPPQLGNCESLRSLLLEGNPFRQPRPAILSQGTPALLDYLRSRIPT